MIQEYDAVVHSLKDVPTTLPDGLEIAAITCREDPRDALVVREKYRGIGCLENLPPLSIVGTSSVRREAMIRRAFPHLSVKLIRGNVNTRLEKLDRCEYDAIILAVAGLNRLGKEFISRIEVILDSPAFLYGVGQGALGLQCRSDDERTKDILFSAANHEDTASQCLAERAFLSMIQGGCQIPVGVKSKVCGEKLTLECVVLSEDGNAEVRSSFVGLKNAPEKIGKSLAAQILQGEGKLLLESFRENSSVLLQHPFKYGSAESPNIDARLSKSS